MRPSYLLAAALLLPGCAHAAPPKPDFANLPAYLQALNRSADPEAKAIRARIASGPADLARERTLAEKAGLATRPAQLVQPLPPPDQNAAPLYLQLDTLRKQKPLHFPPYAQSLKGHVAYTPAQIAVVQKEYDARQDIFTLLHQAADKPQCVFVHDASQTLGFPAEYAKMRENARELATESFLIASQGNFQNAAANEERGFKVSAHIASGPKLIGFLVACPIDGIAVDSLQTILQKAGPNAALDNQVSTDILALPPLSLAHALSGEPAVAAREFEMFRKGNPNQLGQVFPEDSRFSATSPALTHLSPSELTQFNSLLDAAEANTLHQMRSFVAVADGPNEARQSALDEIKISAQNNLTDPIKALSSLISPIASIDLGSLVNQVAARRFVAAAGASALAAKAQTGVFPASLPAQFTDPFTNKPLGYRLEGTNGFVVYSAGPGGTFDGGKPGDKRDNRQSVFRYPLVPRSAASAGQ